MLGSISAVSLSLIFLIGSYIFLILDHISNIRYGHANDFLGRFQLSLNIIALFLILSAFIFDSYKSWLYILTKGNTDKTQAKKMRCFNILFIFL